MGNSNFGIDYLKKIELELKFPTKKFIQKLIYHKKNLFRNIFSLTILLGI